MASNVAFEIREYHESPTSKPQVYIDIEDITSLPAVLRRLHELGHDLSEAFNVLEACEAERKTKAVAAALGEESRASQ